MEIETTIPQSQHAEDIIDAEIATARAILSHNGEVDINRLGDFASETYHRVSDMFVYQDFSCATQFVMVGCGSFPATALHTALRFPSLQIVALDSDALAIELANQVIHKMNLQDRIQVVSYAGELYDYQYANIVYIANLVQPKAKVLSRVLGTAQQGVMTIVREPTSSSTCIESGLDNLSSKWQIEGMGPVNMRFQSKHVFLRTG